MSPKGKTIILANPNASQQKTIILRSVGPDGNTILQQVPISSVSGLQNLTGNTNNIVLTQGAGGNLIKTTTTNQPTQFQQIQNTGAQQQQQQIPALVPSYAPMVITSQTQNSPQIITNLQQQPQQSQQGTRLLLTNSGQFVQTIQQPQQLAMDNDGITAITQKLGGNYTKQDSPRLLKVETGELRQYVLNDICFHAEFI